MYHRRSRRSSPEGLVRSEPRPGRARHPLPAPPLHSAPSRTLPTTITCPEPPLPIAAGENVVCCGKDLGHVEVDRRRCPSSRSSVMPFVLAIERVDGWQHQLVDLGRHRRGTRAHGGSRVKMQGPGARSAPLCEGSRAPGAGWVLWLAQCRGIPPPDAILEWWSGRSVIPDTRAHRFCCQ